MGSENPIEREIRRLQAEAERDEIQLKKTALEGTLILGGILIVGAVVVALFLTWSDSDLTDALQECGKIRVETKDSLLPPVQNDSVDACRKMVFDHFSGTKQ